MGSVLVVDDREVFRLGLAEAIRRSRDQVEALGWEDLHDPHPHRFAVDVVIAVLRPLRDSWDPFAYLGDPRILGRVVESGGRLVGVVAADAPVHPVLTRRFRDSGFAEIVPIDSIRSVDGVAALLAGTGDDPSGDELNAALAREGVGPNSDPIAVLALLREQAESDPAVLRAFDGRTTQQRSGLSRRRIHALRRRVSELGDLRFRSPGSGGGPPRDLSLPRWSQVVEFVDHCRGGGVGEPREPLPRHVAIPKSKVGAVGAGRRR